MNPTSTSKNSWKSKIKSIFILLIAIVIVSVTITTIALYDNKTALKNKYQHKIYVRLAMIQSKIGEENGNPIENVSREQVRSLAMSYEELSTIFASASSQLLNLHYGKGEWDTIARILLGYNNRPGLFKIYDGSLTEEEIAVLNQLSDMSKELLSVITDCSTPGYSNRQNILVMSTKSLSAILDNYNQNTLKEFTKQFTD